jgi:hypothetical protein
VSVVASSSSAKISSNLSALTTVVSISERQDLNTLVWHISVLYLGTSYQILK